MDSKVLFKLGYGLYVVTAKTDKDNGCILNTVMQVTDKPNRILVGVNKGNYTHDMILESRALNVSILSTVAPFSVYEHFGYQSGRNTDKFAGYGAAARSANGLYYITEGTNGYLSGSVENVMDCGTHSVFLVDVEAGEVLDDAPSVTYEYYQDFVKPKPETKQKKGFVCKICGFVYEKEELPADYICPVCRHGAEAFEPL